MEFKKIRSKEDCLKAPKSFDQVECWTDGKWLIVPGYPEAESDHNCDAMGCGQDHIILRILL